MIVKLLTEHHLEFLSLKGGCRGSSEPTLVKMSNCWKSHAAAQMLYHSKTCTDPENSFRVGGGVLKFVYFFSHQRISQRAICTSLKKQLYPLSWKAHEFY